MDRCVVAKMVRTVYLCEECGLMYSEKKWADACEEWCRVHKSCNIEITKHAVNRPRLSV
ncbi:MAG: hypothetical protein HXY34_00650 [Candidatus Thorarchaeota archaeon]|nr:hypothetical protein [Candidatus Thorarchaeota archaeon]